MSKHNKRATDKNLRTRDWRGTSSALIEQKSECYHTTHGHISEDIKMRREKTQISKIRNEKREIATITQKII
jgi:hypothetical protein